MWDGPVAEGTLHTSPEQAADYLPALRTVEVNFVVMEPRLQLVEWSVNRKYCTRSKLMQTVSGEFPPRDQYRWGLKEIPMNLCMHYFKV
jgi:hypothetical protein